MADRIGGSFPDDRAERRGARPERTGYGRDRREGDRGSRRPGPSGSGFRQDRDRPSPRASDRSDRGSFPRIPDSITEDELSRDAKAELRGLPTDLAATVGRYLVAAELASDPEQAYRYAQAARSLAARIGVVREVNGITAYHTGRWAEALAELRAARRLTGRAEYLSLMADSERALGRLDRALELVHSDDAKRLPRAAQIELRIVESGIRRDQGLADAAVLVLQVPELTDGRLRPWSARLFYAYGEALLAAGRPEAAREAFSRAVVADEDEETDALSRLDEMDGITLEDLEDEDEDLEDADKSDDLDEDDLTDEAGDGLDDEFDDDENLDEDGLDDEADGDDEDLDEADSDDEDLDEADGEDEGDVEDELDDAADDAADDEDEDLGDETGPDDEGDGEDEDLAGRVDDLEDGRLDNEAAVGRADDPADRNHADEAGHEPQLDRRPEIR